MDQGHYTRCNYNKCLGIIITSMCANVFTSCWCACAQIDADLQEIFRMAAISHKLLSNNLTRFRLSFAEDIMYRDDLLLFELFSRMMLLTIFTLRSRVIRISFVLLIIFIRSQFTNQSCLSFETQRKESRIFNMQCIRMQLQRVARSTSVRGFASAVSTASSRTKAAAQNSSAAILNSFSSASNDIDKNFERSKSSSYKASSAAAGNNDIDDMSDAESQEFLVNILAQQLGEDDPSVKNLRKAIASRKALSKRDWTDLDFMDGEDNKANLEKLEKQFCQQIVTSSVILLEGAQVNLINDNSPTNDSTNDRLPSSDPNVTSDALALLQNPHVARCFENMENLGSALDLVGAYLKNYQVDKADAVMKKIMPECRKLGGMWLTKALNHHSTVRMKQSRYDEAKEMLEEQISTITLSEEEAWEAFDMLYRNMGAVLTALGQVAEGLEFYQKSVRVKRTAGVDVTWFDLWDIGKSHALLGFQQSDMDKISLARESIESAVTAHERDEGHDKIMRAKILHSLGETYLAKGVMLETKNPDERSQIVYEYEHAVKHFKHAHELFGTYSGKNCPLTGGQARAVADGLIRLQRLEECKPYLRNALEVESTKDAPQLNQLWHLLENILTVYQKSDDRDLISFVNVCEAAIQNSQSKSLHDQDPQLFANVCGKCMLIALAGGDRLASTKFAGVCQGSLDEMKNRGIEDSQGLGGLIQMMQITQLAGGSHKLDA